MALVVDTSVLFAGIDADDPDHEACARLLGATRETIVVPSPVLVDAAVVVTCEALGEGKVATLDRRHFSVVRTSDGAPLQLLPG